MLPEEKALVHDWQNENAICRNAADEAECFLRWVRVAVGTEQQRLRQVFLSIAELHGLPVGALLLFDVAIRDCPCIVDPPSD